VQALAEAQE